MVDSLSFYVFYLISYNALELFCKLQIRGDCGLFGNDVFCRQVGFIDEVDRLCSWVNLPAALLIIGSACAPASSFSLPLTHFIGKARDFLHVVEEEESGSVTQRQTVVCLFLA